MRWTPVILLLVVSCTPLQDVPPLERQAQRINRSLMCPVCPGESIDQSQVPLAKQMRAIVMEKLEQGWTEEEIKAFFVERYGPRVLMAPPREEFSLLAWLLPPLGVLGAGIALYLVLRWMRRSAPSSSAQELTLPQLTEEERARYFRRLEEVLGWGGEKR